MAHTVFRTHLSYLSSVIFPVSPAARLDRQAGALTVSSYYPWHTKPSGTKAKGKDMPTLLVLLLLCYVILSKNSFFIALPPNWAKASAKVHTFSEPPKYFQKKIQKNFLLDKYQGDKGEIHLII